MKRKSILFVAVLAVFLHFASTGITNAENVFPIGSKLDNFTMPDPDGKDHSFDDLKGENGALIVFLSVQCPIVKMYDERINEIADAYKAKGINFIGIYSNKTEPVEAVKAHIEGLYKFPILMDYKNVFADKLGATRTPEVYYFNAKNILEYHGAIDNDRTGQNISKTYLKSAFDQKLSGKEITEKETTAFGCSIKRIEKADMVKEEVGR